MSIWHICIFRTINRFRKEKGNQLTPLFVQIVQKTQELGLISFGVVSIDGTKIYTDASKHKNLDMETLEKRRFSYQGIYNRGERLKEKNSEDK